MCVKCVEKKKLLGRHKKDIPLIKVHTFAKWQFNYCKKMQKQPLEVFYKKAVLPMFAIFTGKHLKS